MIKAVEWAIGGVVAVAIWSGMLLNLSSLDLDAFEKHLVLYVPLYAVISFGLISLGIICYRVATFRDCPEAAEELQHVGTL
ncbi:hypothetical protein RvY_09887-2 [Ramazzottius varieornatus]|uniref:Dolichol-phosphate mannosyltransferase subunit 3 n=1 Tax=Ramazzottius varieornatus TaxID=947166 RepID=A0A1D1VAX1_RAMVA|nr:hypothetical protein RvY_09887-2 [Ramazzottius varieornatus]